MNSQQFVAAGHKMIDYAIKYMETINDREPLPHVEPGYLTQIMPDSAPVKGEGFDAIFNDLERVVVEGNSHWQHPQFASYFPAGNSWPSILGDILSNGLGVNGTSWEACPVLTELEMIVADWVAKMMGVPNFFWTPLSNPESEGGGCIQTCASDAIMLGMICAREDCVKSLKAKFPQTPRAVLLNKMVAYRSSQCHSSVERAGLIGNMRLRPLAADDLGNVRGRVLSDAIKEDIKEGLIPYLYVAVLGSTGICAFDDLMEVGPICEEYGMWLHVDAAYAGSCFTCPEMRYLSKGMEYAWSLNTNMNKWMLTNFDCSFLWLRWRQKMVGPMTGYDESKWKTPQWPIVALRHFGTPATRRFRAVKMWFVLRNYGISGLQKYHRNHILMSKIFERYCERDERFEVVGPTRVGLCCFRMRGTNDISAKMLDAINLSRRLHMVPSYFHEKYVIRYAPCYQFLSEADVATSWQIVDEFATAILHQSKKEGVDLDVLAPLYEIQDYMDNYYAQSAGEGSKGHGHSDAWKKGEEAAEALVASHKHEKIVDLFAMANRDGSFGLDSEEDGYDGYLKAHPELLKRAEHKGQPKTTDKVPSMLRIHQMPQGKGQGNEVVQPIPRQSVQPQQQDPRQSVKPQPDQAQQDPRQSIAPQQQDPRQSVAPQQQDPRQSVKPQPDQDPRQSIAPQQQDPRQSVKPQPDQAQQDPRQSIAPQQQDPRQSVKPQPDQDPRQSIAPQQDPRQSVKPQQDQAQQDPRQSIAPQQQDPRQSVAPQQDPRQSVKPDQDPRQSVKPQPDQEGPK